MKRVLLLVLVCAVVGYICSFLFSPTTSPLEYLQSPKPIASPSLESSTPFAPTPSEDSVSVPQTHPPLSEIAPSEASVRNEVKKDPHSTPRSLILFSAELGKRMEIALQDEKAGSVLFSELSDCVRDQPPKAYVLSARALCFTDTSELAKRYPRLKPHFEALKEALSPEEQKRFESIDKITALGE